MAPKPPKAKSIMIVFEGLLQMAAGSASIVIGSKGAMLTGQGMAADGVTPAPLMEPSPGQDLGWVASPAGIVTLTPHAGTLTCTAVGVAAGSATVTANGHALTGGAAVSGTITIVVTAPAATSIAVSSAPIP